MKKIFTLMLAAGMLLGAASGAKAIDFKASGEWLVGFGLGDGSLIKDVDNKKRHHEDTFSAGLRVRLQLDAVASESLSGTVFFEIGDQMWGQSESGGALGADSTSVVKLKNAYIDWMVPNTDLKLRMGLQAVALPNVAGGSAIMDGDAAAVVASYQFNENVGLTALWMRPLNDNYTGTNADGEAYGNGHKNYLDNMDLFALMLPLKFDGVELTPWAMYGMQGKNARFNEGGVETADGALSVTLPGYYPGMNFGPGGLGHTGKAYGSMFWAGLPVAITAFDPLNIEFDINYGYVEAMGRYDVLKRGVESVLGNSKREGWLVKALVEYKMDWGTPGIFGWYASGDDGNVKNGSERLPSIAGAGNFTSFMGDGNLAWGTGFNFYDNNLTYAGTWGIGLQIADVSFVEDLKHTFRVAYWGGTNSPSMV
ncbi:outer membrane homotrimeric porin, partial [Desulfovibrio sp.]|uniref:outer membrane homotrimeric porin n=1 Tax=Desulfovibrio sp. TaxID=885 RepID=UPI002580B7C9